MSEVKDNLKLFRDFQNDGVVSDPDVLLCHHVIYREVFVPRAWQKLKGKCYISN